MPLIFNPQAMTRFKAHGTRHYLELGNDAPAPDPAIGEAAKANAAIAGRMQDLAETQYTDQKALLAEYSPLLKSLIQSNVDAQQTSTDQSAAQWKSYTDTWQPIEQELAKQSLAMADPAKAQQEADRAASTAATQYDRATADGARTLQAAGASPERVAAMQASAGLSGAKAIAGAASGAYRDTQKAGLAYLDNAARFGRNMTSTGIATAQLAGQQGQAASGGVYGLQSATGAGAAQAGSLFSQAVGANSAAGQLGLANYNAQLQASQANNGFLGDLIGAGAGLLGSTKTAGGASGLAALTSFFSSEKLKHMGPKVNGNDAEEAVEKANGDSPAEERAEGKKGHNAKEEAAERRAGDNPAEEAIEASPSKQWSYKPGLGDGDTRTRMGPTAESLRDATGGVVSDGTKVDGIALLGLHHAAIANQSKRLRRLEKRAGLAHARKGA